MDFISRNRNLTSPSDDASGVVVRHPTLNVGDVPVLDNLSRMDYVREEELIHVYMAKTLDKELNFRLDWFVFDLATIMKNFSKYMEDWIASFFASSDTHLSEPDRTSFLLGCSL